ncbi:Myb/SANT-like DNA-binding domain-containing protein [Cinnamomum micranthum f. kanehirae]|uniref:Myb/SANT-like DNA-binding domain-containing protein n=1 Tax=Cinnamomum micranthum f. kanehirae TaxID=337451 RepID=A0A443NM70_9MAGN|nr:Myb/SANT-like DNA-binding domain-containing protein [Cinnamomum micranthum f. kanehirae]
MKPSSWKRIIARFNEKTGLGYRQKQLKNTLDIMKKQYATWNKLIGQKGITFNEHIHTVSMEPERWKDYLKENPDAKVFHTKPLQFPAEMTILFGANSASGEATWTPALDIVSNDVLRGPSSGNHSSHDCDTSLGLSNTQGNTQQEEDEEIGLDDQVTNNRHKRQCLPRSRKDLKSDALGVSIEHLISSIVSTRKTDAPTIAECIASLKQIPHVPRKLYLFALNAFRVKENREIWMSEEDDAIRMEWLVMNMDGCSTA